MRGRSGTVSSRLDPLGRRGVTKRFANPARSRATRGRENAWLEARSPLPLGRRGRPSKTTTTTRSFRLAYRGDRFSPFLRPRSFFSGANFSNGAKFPNGDVRWGRSLEASFSSSAAVTSAMRWVSVPRPQRYRSAVRHGSTANRQRPRAPSSLSPSSLAAPWTGRRTPSSRAYIVSQVPRSLRPP